MTFPRRPLQSLDRAPPARRAADCVSRAFRPEARKPRLRQVVGAEGAGLRADRASHFVEVVDEDRDLVDRAVRLFLAALPRRLRFVEVAVMLRATPVGLEAAFVRQGLKPRDHLRRVRLEHLHGDLLAGRCTDADEALTRWGFPSASPDVQGDYRRRFGCYPHQTLDAARRRPRCPVDAGA